MDFMNDIQEAEAILEDINPSPLQVVGVGVVFFYFYISFSIIY